MSTEDTTAGKDDNDVSICANCGKGEEESDKLKACTACKLVKYCNRECQIAHRPQHKKECKKRASELHDIELFKQPPPKEDCPICILLLPTLWTGHRYMTCCGQLICSGCVHAPVYDQHGNEMPKKTCPFCRTPFPKSTVENTQRKMKRVEAKDAQAMHSIGCCYAAGKDGFPEDDAKALELWHRAAELGHAPAYVNIAYAYDYGNGVEVDKKKSIRYFELAAMGGDMYARYVLGNLEYNADRALKHHMIAVAGGHTDSLNKVEELYSKRLGNATKDDYNKAVQSYQTYLDEIKSIQRDKAAEYNEEYRYYGIDYLTNGDGY